MHRRCHWWWSLSLLFFCMAAVTCRTGRIGPDDYAINGEDANANSSPLYSEQNDLRVHERFGMDGQMPPMQPNLPYCDEIEVDDKNSFYTTTLWAVLAVIIVASIISAYIFFNKVYFKPNQQVE